MDTVIFVAIAFAVITSIGYVVIAIKCGELLEKRFNLGDFESLLVIIILSLFPLILVLVYLFFSFEGKANTAKKATRKRK